MEISSHLNPAEKNLNQSILANRPKDVQQALSQIQRLIGCDFFHPELKPEETINFLAQTISVSICHLEITRSSLQRLGIESIFLRPSGTNEIEASIHLYIRQNKIGLIFDTSMIGEINAEYSLNQVFYQTKSFVSVLIQMIGQMMDYQNCPESRCSILEHMAHLRLAIKLSGSEFG